MSTAAYAIGKRAVENVTKYDLKGAFGMGRKIVGARWKQAATRQGKQALMARMAVGAMGGGLYGYSQGDWKSGAMMGAAGGAGWYMMGGRAGMKSMARKAGFMGRTGASKAAAAKAAAAPVDTATSHAVTSSGARTGRWGNVGWVKSAQAKDEAAERLVSSYRAAERQRLTDAPKSLGARKSLGSIRSGFSPNAGHWIDGSFVSEADFQGALSRLAGIPRA